MKSTDEKILEVAKKLPRFMRDTAPCKEALLTFARAMIDLGLEEAAEICEGNPNNPFYVDGRIAAEEIRARKST